MTVFTFYKNGELFTGFGLRGHCNSGPEDFEGRLVCAAVSSAAQLAANTITEILKCPSQCSEDESAAELELILTVPDVPASHIIDGLRLHISELSGQYPSRVSFVIEGI